MSETATAERFEAIILEKENDAGVTVVGGRPYMNDAKGNLVPVAMIKAVDKLEDETVRKVMKFADEISAQIARFRVHTMVDLDGFDELLEQEYGAKKGGRKGNRTYQSFDGLLRVQVSINDFEDYGPQLQTAKQLIDECLNEWTAEGRPEIQALVTKAFSTDKAGKINRDEIHRLTTIAIDDPRWKEAVRAIQEARRVNYSKQYVRFYRRASLADNWQAVTVDLAKAGA